MKNARPRAAEIATEELYPRAATARRARSIPSLTSLPSVDPNLSLFNAYNPLISRLCTLFHVNQIFLQQFTSPPSANRAPALPTSSRACGITTSLPLRMLPFPSQAPDLTLFNPFYRHPASPFPLTSSFVPFVRFVVNSLCPISVPASPIM